MITLLWNYGKLINKTNDEMEKKYILELENGLWVLSKITDMVLEMIE